ncbi:S-layer family protein [Microbacterium sp. SS28]|uniref:beta strand repeat-containing protein n=1 Tax=Microbacterium sp. SS28 TaxID=2919948 RepID=UPI001FAB1346|nr:Ig-like domain repeat protein [Microbacterium sp. SS28]
MAGSDTPRAAVARSRFRRRGVAASIAVILAVLGGALIAPSIAQADGPTTFSNSASIAIPAAGSAEQTGPASPYPSTITVSGLAGAVSAVQVVFHGLTHGVLNDVDAMVVSPSGQSLVVLSDIGDPTTTLAFANNATLTFDDAAAGPVPTGNVPTGTYRPTNNGAGDPFPAPAPAPSAQTTLSGAFTGIDPNGTWQLFIVDDAKGDLGSMAGGWSLVVTTEVSAVATTTAVATSGSPSATGAAVTFTATVSAAGSPVTAGTVAFTADGAPLGTAAVNAAGLAQVTTNALAEGTHAILATYSGSTGFLTSNGSVSQRVDNATVVTGSTYCNTGPLTTPLAGPAVPYPSNITVSGLTAPVSKVTVTLNGVSHSAPIDLDVMLASPVPATNLMLMSDVGGTSAVSGATIVFDDAAPGSVPTPLTSGTFRPTDDDSDSADAAFPAPAPIVSSATTLATFNGASGNGVWSLWVLDDATGDAGSISGGWCLTLATVSPTTTALTSSVNPSVVGGSVTFTATVTAGGAPVTAGSVAFADGGTPLGASVALAADGTATVTTSALTAGTHSLTATYSGTPDFATSSGSLSQVVDVTPTVTTVTSDLNPSHVGDAVTFTATVTAGGAPVTAGTVAFTDGGAPLGGSIPVDATGRATFTTSALTAGTHPVTATFSGTPVFATSSGSLSQVVDVTPTVTTVTSDLNPSHVGDAVTFTATVTAGGAPVTAGTVSFAEGGTPLATGTPLAADGTATFTTSSLTAGTHTITATYSGTPVFAAGSATLDQTVQAPLVAVAGGPYSVAEGADLSLDASGSTPGAAYAWDLNADGDFTDATGLTPTLTWTQLEELGIDDGPSTHTVALRVTAGLQVATSSASLDVTNTAPDTVVTGALTATAGVLFTIKVGADDPSSADMAALFGYTVDWGDGTPVLSVNGPADPPVSHLYTAPGTYAASLTATDKDGGTGEPLTIEVVVAPAEVPPPVVPPVVPPAVPPGLPPTGADPRGALLAAGILFLVGASMVVAARRRRPIRR